MGAVVTMQPKKSNAPEPGSEAWGTWIRKRAKVMADQEDQSKLALAELLYVVMTTPVDGFDHNPPIYTAWGYASFYDYASEELGLQRKKAKTLANIWHTIVEKNIAPKLQKRLMKLGWTKTRELIRVINESNAVQWIEMAEQTNHPDLCANIQRALEKAKQQAAIDGTEPEEEPPPPEEGDKMVSMSMPLYPDQKANVELALKRAAELANSPWHKKCHHLDLICTNFLATNDFKFANDPDMKWKMLANMEQHLGVRLVAVDPVQKRIVYGYDALELIATDGDDD